MPGGWHEHAATLGMAPSFIKKIKRAVGQNFFKTASFTRYSAHDMALTVAFT
jgi:hypothetical protein